MKQSLVFQLMFSVYKCLGDGRQREKQDKKKLLLPLVNQVIKKASVGHLADLATCRFIFFIPA